MAKKNRKRLIIIQKGKNKYTASKMQGAAIKMYVIDRYIECEKIKEIAEKRGNVFFTGKIKEEQLFDLYKRAKVHVLPSFRESPGLSTLEALICGTQIVVSNEKFCPIKYYKFDKYGFVCNPYDVNSIRNSILNAYNNPKDISLPDDYIKFFSYENAANMTYNVYERVLGEKQ